MSERISSNVQKKKIEPLSTNHQKNSHPFFRGLFKIRENPSEKKKEET